MFSGPNIALPLVAQLRQGAEVSGVGAISLGQLMRQLPCCCSCSGSRARCGQLRQLGQLGQLLRQISQLAHRWGIGAGMALMSSPLRCMRPTIGSRRQLGQMSRSVEST